MVVFPVRQIWDDPFSFKQGIEMNKATLPLMKTPIKMGSVIEMYD